MNRGVNTSFVKMFRTTLNTDGLSNVKIHAFDNWQADKYDFTSQFASDAALNSAVDIIGAHTTWKAQTTGGVMAPAAAKIAVSQFMIPKNMPLWTGIAGATNIVNAVNENYIDNRVTKVVFWFLIGSLPPVVYLNMYGSYPALMDADQPWCGYYDIKMGLWDSPITDNLRKPAGSF